MSAGSSSVPAGPTAAFSRSITSGGMGLATRISVMSGALALQEPAQLGLENLAVVVLGQRRTARTGARALLPPTHRSGKRPGRRSPPGNETPGWVSGRECLPHAAPPGARQFRSRAGPRNAHASSRLHPNWSPFITHARAYLFAVATWPI